MQTFTEEELQKYNGQNGMPAYVAFKGNVYDLSESPLWKNGVHFKKHFAGNDLTAMIANAPHSEEVFANFSPIALYISSPSADTNKIADPKEKYRVWYAKYHPHPLTVHFPIALHYFSGFADVLFLANPSVGYETAVFLSFFAATVMGFFTLIAGIFSWWVNYDCITSKPFMIKLTGALFTLVIGLVPLIQKFLAPDVPFSHGLDGIIYHSVIFMTVMSVSIVGYYGGKITWGAKS
ncbi:DUF2231 domain-containing protein [Sulfuricurvum sp.]|uniref:DUF2231 domain-containing protein n=1 Tax=Sulfuricurvum sp. TaxID=2025608 RepID=UPI00261C2371|nr:DUF2231 domain-containing protein [Sulfuricurvum sp.]MDD2839354.1 cytochrome b5 domain-containing protein [Sulfuricurvum sp.]MDD3597355.1 cytochrome b5 domain-containing protein [Sulfuricurvum sp.]